jgi:nitrite reductase (NADH) small subunit
VVAEPFSIRASEVPEGEGKIVKVGTVEIGIFNVGGKYYALSNWCPHEGGPVCTGYVTGTVFADQSTDWIPRWVKDGEIICCPWHGLEFEIKDGVCISRKSLRIRTYKVVESDGMITVDT